MDRTRRPESRQRRASSGTGVPDRVWSQTANRAAVATVIACADLVAFGVVARLAYQIEPGIGPATMVGWTLLTVISLAVAGAYRSRLTYSALSDLPQLLGRSAAGGAVGGRGERAPRRARRDDTQGAP